MVATVFVAGFIAMSLMPLMAGQDSELSKQSDQRAEGLAYQLLQIYSEHQKLSSSSRGPASETGDSGVDWSQWKPEGEIGRDPWGDPYKYQIISSESENLSVIQVWSRNTTEKIRLKVK
jgi:hypothetical protein